MKRTQNKLLYTKKVYLMYIYVSEELSEHARNPQLHVLSTWSKADNEDILCIISVRLYLTYATFSHAVPCFL